jgi:hypothetical protein
MSGMTPFDMANAKPDGVERGKEGKRQNRANGSASDQHIIVVLSGARNRLLPPQVDLLSGSCLLISICP